MHEVEAVQVFMVFCGIVCGLIGTAYPFALFVAAIKDGKNSSVNMASGLASILSSFLLLSLAELLVFSVAADQAMAFFLAMLMSFLLVWAGGAVWAWRAVNGCFQ